MSKHMLAPYALVILRKNNHVAFLKRSNSASFAPGLYSLIGGRVEQNETFRQSLIREIFEEVGVTIDQADLHFVHAFYRKGSEELVAFIFECTHWQGEPFNKEPHKHSELVWIDFDALPENMLPAHEGALELIKQNFSYSEQK